VRLVENLFSAIVTEALQQHARDKLFPRYLTGFINILKTRSHCGIVQFRLRIDCRVVIDLLHSGFDPAFITDMDDEHEVMRDVWVHGYLLAYSQPQLVAQYYAASQKPNPFETNEAESESDDDSGSVLVLDSDSDSDGAHSIISISSTEPDIVIDLTDE